MKTPTQSRWTGEKTDLLKKLQANNQRKEQPRISWSRRGMGVIVVAAVFAVVAISLFAHRNDSFALETATAVSPRALGGSNVILESSGYVIARRQATVSAQITGAIHQVLIEEGDHVEAGQLLTRLDNAAQQALLSQAQAQLEVAQALLAQNQAQFAQARRDLKRNEELVEQKLVSQQALEGARMQVETLQAQVDSQRKQVELARAAVQGAEVQLDYTLVRAPFAGVVVAKTAQPGEIISPVSAGGGFTRTGVCTIVDMGSLEIEVNVNEAFIHRIQPEQRAQAVLDAYPSSTFPAHVIAIIPTADRSKATVRVRIAIDKKDPRILPDMGVRVSFLGTAATHNPTVQRKAESRPSAGVWIPCSAITERDQNNVVFTIAADRARAKIVTSTQTRGDRCLVQGIPNGATVARAPPSNLDDNAAVTLKGG